MRLLLDTHTFLWWRVDEARLSPEVRAAIGGAESVFVSMATAWEIAIKVSMGKLRMSGTVEERLVASHFEPLPIGFRHMERVAILPFHHRDPFDRMLIAQCQVERLTLVTADRRLQRYEVPFLWV
ncbi:MAG: type II toxin-antitoxin system VapC family toxin [Alphaproteobacteria bacterium]|nr:type II toxin-antitoxin system VapC family toxin [Alphaproteobacteria bacterium]